MENIDIIWKILGIITVVLLIGFWRRRNAVWGGFTAGIVIGLIVAIVFVFQNKVFDWFIVGKAAVSGTMVGFIAELLGKISDHLKLTFDSS